ncbi:unnamed protein product, partial [Prorocentrum cordatum]
DGRSPCIWDTFCAVEGKVKNNDNGTTACDHYHRWKEDVALMKKLGLPAYRFSIAWSRLLPEGRGEVNPKGVEFYNNLINELIANKITPLVTIYHWDLPECLDKEYGGWLSPKIIDDFEYYSKVWSAGSTGPQWHPRTRWATHEGITGYRRGVGPQVLL